MGLRYDGRLTPIWFGVSMAILMASLAAAYTCGSCIVNFFFLTDSFVLGGSHQVCEMPLNNRCVTHFTIRRGNGVQSDLVLFGNEFENYRLVPGMTFDKQHVGFVYEIDGSVERWPFLKSQIMYMSLGVVGFIFWVFIGGIRVAVDWLKMAKKLRW